jgi:cytochrome P450
MAQGGGETLDAFASLLGIRAEDKPAFFRLTQARFADLYAGDAVTAGAMLASLERAMAGDERFASYLDRG